MGMRRFTVLRLALSLASSASSASRSAPCPHCEFVSYNTAAIGSRALLETASSPRASLRLETPLPIDHLSSISLVYDIPRHDPASATPAPAGQDWIGVYCVDDESDPNRDGDFIDVVDLRARNTTGGRVTIERIPNMRCSWQFRLFRLLNGKNFLLAHTPFVRMKRGKEEPLQVHIALTGNATKMRVMWVSGLVHEPRVFYGDESGKLDRRADATVSSYEASDMCEAPATTTQAKLFRDPGQLYEAVMTGLEPGETYFYQVVGDLMDDPSASVSSKVFRFTATLEPGQEPAEGDSRSQSFFVYGDMGDWDIGPLGALPGNRTAATAELMREDMDSEAGKHQWLMALHDGDISYAKGRTYLWDQFGSIIQPVAAELPYMVGVGNHDYCYESGGEGKDPSGAGPTAFHPPNGPGDCESGGECGVPLSKRFTMPKNGNGLFWYSFRVGLMHHIMLSGEHDFTAGAPMYNWFLHELQTVNRKQTPWLFVHIHRPMYCSEQYEADYQLSLLIRKHLEPLCAAFGVDVVFSGHYHAYERTCAVFQDQCRSEIDALGVEKARAPVHIMVGSAGASLDTAGYFAVPWSRRALQEYGYGRMHVYNASHALYEFKSNVERRVVDSVWIVSDHTWHEDALVVDKRVYGEKRQTEKPQAIPLIDRHTILERQRERDEAILGIHVETPEDLVRPSEEMVRPTEEAMAHERRPSDEVLRVANNSSVSPATDDQAADETNEDWW